MQNNNLILGKKISFPKEYDPKLLTSIDRISSRISTEIYRNKFYGLDRWTCYELSWLGVNGNPKNGVLSIEYSSESPFFIESKSLKLYLMEFRNCGAFHEAVTNRIIDDLQRLLNARFIRLRAQFNVRGGIYTTIVAENQQSEWNPAPDTTLPGHRPNFDL